MRRLKKAMEEVSSPVVSGRGGKIEEASVHLHWIKHWAARHAEAARELGSAREAEAYEWVLRSHEAVIAILKETKETKE